MKLKERSILMLRAGVVNTFGGVFCLYLREYGI